MALTEMRPSVLLGQCGAQLQQRPEMMHHVRTIMGMPVAVVVSSNPENLRHIEAIFDHFTAIDNRFSPYIGESELSRMNRGEIAPREQSPQMREVLALAAKTRAETQGYFNIRRPDGSLDTSGIVKGWAIRNAALLLETLGYDDFLIDVAGDIQPHGCNAEGGEWRIGIRNPFQPSEIVKVLYPKGSGVATSGTYVQGQHIYNPHAPDRALNEIVSLTIIGPDVLEADRYATAAFAMGRNGIVFVEQLAGFEGYEIDNRGIARMTSGLARYLSC